MTFDQLLDLLKRAKGELNTLAAADLSVLSDDDFDATVLDFAEFHNSVRSAANYLAALRKQRNA